MSVFISYRHTDRIKAKEINDMLNNAGIVTYLDVLDPESLTTNDITSVITQRIEKSTHLIAVVSEDTALSWWVPFEIGEATITNRRICSYKTGLRTLPEYLSKWPVMTKLSDIRLFIQEYTQDRTSNRTAALSAGIESFSQNAKSNAALFHNNLKRRITFGY